MNVASLTATLSDYFADLGCDALPEDVRDHTVALILDALGCGLVGSTTEEGERLRRTALAMAGGEGLGGARLWGTDLTAPLPMAVMANSVAVHTREIDDFSLAYHAGSVVVPAAIGVAAAVGATGAELIAAVAAGYEISCRIAQGGAAPGQPGFLPFKKKGWHSTALFGPFGAAVAAAKLLKLDTAGLRSAIGIAGSMAGGTWAFIDEGNTIKRVHPGLASKSGVTAAFLAREGITGPAKILEADWGGFYASHLQGEPTFPEHVTGKLGSDWQLMHAGFKPYASCRRIHSALDALFETVRKHGIAAEGVAAITVHGHALHKRQLSKFPVSTILEAQFSLPYTLSAALTDHSGGLDLYRLEKLGRPEVARLAQNVKVEIDPALAETGEPRVEFTLTDGRTLSETVHVPKGHPENPLTKDELWGKFRTNAGLVYGAEGVAELVSVMETLPSLRDARIFDRLLAAPSQGMATDAA